MLRNRRICVLTDDKPWWLVGGVPSQNCIAAYQPIGASSLATSYTNLANPGTYDAAPGTAPAWATTTGWTFNGTTNNRYLKTGIVPVNNQSWSMLIKLTGAVDGPIATIFGEYNTATNDFLIQPRRSNAVLYFSGAQVIVEPGCASGVLGISGLSLWRNGLLDGTLSGSPSGVNALEIYMGALNLTNSATQFYTGNILAFCIYSTIITSRQVLAVTTAMNAL